MTCDAYFAGGCFWCITPVFEEMHGVLSVRCGYSGGSKEDAVYEKVKSQQTLHRETLRVTYDAEKVSYGELLDVFLSSVDPFDGGGQFIDRGRSYTLAVFFGDESEKNEATAKLKKLEAESGRKIFVSVEGFVSFYDAEEYHQEYYIKNPEAFEKELEESGRKQRKQ